jgi:hypothetical protein
MRLLRCSLTVDDQHWIPAIEEFFTDIPPYAILSHRWGKPNDEVSFNDLERGLNASHKPGYRKLRRFCELAFQAGLEFAWIDTCCIDKKSSAELSEAINSMFEWYSNSVLCYAYLDDVITEETLANHAMENSSFRASKWWTRGWTLQELIAPGSVLFVDQNWKPIETRNRLAWLVGEITSIEIEVLRDDYNWRNHRTSVAQKMSWAARRQTTRQEDRAYSLMGLFGVNMPLLYGEGPRAFIRLQEEIMRTIPDQSLFAWRGGVAFRGLLAASVEQFADCGHIVSVDYNEYVGQFQNKDPVPNFSQTNYGTQIQLPMQALKTRPSIHRAFIACTTQDRYPPKIQEDFCSIMLWGQPGVEVHTYHRVDLPIDAMDASWRSSWGRLEIRDLFVSSLYSHSYGYQTLANKIVREVTEVEFHLAVSKKQGHAHFFPLYDSISSISGATWIRSQANLFMAKFPANPADNADAFMALHVGSAKIQGFQDDESSDPRFTFNFFVLCGIYKGVLWTDVLIQPGVETANGVYNAYKSSTDLGGKARSAARNSTEIELRQLLSPQDIHALLPRNRSLLSTKYEDQYHHIPNAKFGVYIAVDYSARATKNTYRAVVILEWNSFRVVAALYRDAVPSIPQGNLRTSSQG